MAESYKIYVDCANCANLMEHAAEKTEGVKSAVVNFMTQELKLEFEDGADKNEVIKRVYRNCKDIEEDCEIYFDGNEDAGCSHHEGHHHHDGECECEHRHEPNHDHVCCGYEHEHHHSEKCGCEHEAANGYKPNHDHVCCGYEHEHHHSEKCGCEHEAANGHEPNHDHVCCGYEHEHHHSEKRSHKHDDEPVIWGLTRQQLINIIRIIVAAVFVLLSEHFKDDKVLSIVLFVIAYITAGYDVLARALRGILRGHPFDENFLMAVATVGAVGLGDYTEGAAVMIFYQIGELFESIAVGRSRRNINDAIDIRPDYANVLRPGGEIEKVSPSELETGSIIVVKPGEKVPIDGIILEGGSSIDTSALTGESVLKDVEPGFEVLSGSVNMTGVLRIKTTKLFGESTASKILDMVENASSSKSKSEDFISKFARIYTPVVCYMALALAVIPPLINIAGGSAADWSTWLYRAFTFLVISCPCALVISIPLSFFGGLGGASKSGILIKGANFMEPLADTSCVVFDKTGTMTTGVLEVCGVHHSPYEEETLIEYAAHAECYSSHPISLAIQRRYEREPDRTRVSNVREIGGEGVCAIVDGHEIACGNAKLMKRVGVEHIECHSHGTVIHVSIDGVYSGHILVADTIKPNAAAAVSELKRNGIGQVIMLTGDSTSTAQHVASQIGIEEVYGDLLPADKLLIVERLIQKQKSKKEKLIFVGDGINDAPVLARSDIGAAMGGIGSDAAIEASDIVIMDDDPLKLVKGIKIARKCIRIVYENIYFAIGIKVLCLILTALGLAGMWMAIFADTGVLILAVLNAVRALDVKHL